MKKMMVATAALVLIVAACADGESAAEPAAAPSTVASSAPTTLVEEETTTIPEQVPEPIDLAGPTQGGQVQTGEVPQGIIDDIVEDAVTRLSTAADAVTIVLAEQVIWSDGSLGCPQPGVVYTQALIEGYRVVVDAAGELADYRVRGNGSFTVCERGTTSPSGLGRGGTVPAGDK